MADRTVSVRLRAQVGDFVAEMNIAGAAVDAFGKKVDGTSKKTTDGFKKTDESAQKTSKSVQRSSAQMGTWMTSAVSAAVGLAPPLIAAGAAAAAFGAVAAPSIIKVVAAQKDLANSWTTLDGRQKATSAHLGAVIGQYQDLAKAYEPEALAVFNGLMGDTSVLMGRAKPLLDAGAQGVTRFTSQIDSFVTGGTMKRFLDFEAKQAGPALDQLGQGFAQTGTLALNLAHDLTPMGMTLLSTANTGLRFLNTVEQISPHLAEAGVAALALRAPTQALSDLWETGATKVGKWASKTSEADGKLTKLAKGAVSAEGFLGKLGRTISAAPSLYIGAALGVVYLTQRLSAMRDSTEQLIDSVRTETNAFGNNAAGHLAAAKSLTTYIAQERAAAQAAKVGAGDIRDQQHITTVYNGEIKKLTDARKQELTAANNITAGEADLSRQYKISATQANQLATAAGVDLSKGITGSGAAAQAAQAKIRAYRQAVLDAQDPTRVISQALEAAGNSTLALKDRMTALTNAFGALAGPELQAYDATTKTAQAFDQFDAAMKKSKGSMSLTTTAGQNARTAFVGLLSTVEQNIDAQYQYDSATKGAAVAERNRAASARTLLPVLLAEAGGNKQAQQALLDWANAAGVGKTRADAMGAALGTTKAGFIAAAREAGKSRDEALKLWAAYQRFAQPLRLSVDDAQFLAKLHAAQGLKIDPKTGLLLGNNADYFNKWLKARGLKLDPKTGLFLGNGADYYNKWLRANGLRIDTKTGRIVGNTAAFWSAVNSIPAVVGHRTIAVSYSAPAASANEPGHTRADGGIDRYAAGGVRRDLDPFVAASPTVLFGETSTGGEAFIPLGSQKRQRSVMLLSDVAQMFGLAVVKPATAMADGGVMQSFASGGTAGDISLSTILSDWSTAVSPSTKAQVDAAAKSKRTQVNQLAAAEDALARARKKGSSRDIAAAERRIATERSDLAAATSKLADVEARYKFTAQKPATQLGSALSLDIKAKAAFVKNLTTLTDRGFGPLAQQLLAMGDAQAEKIAADAVKLSDSKLKTLNSQVGQAQQQATQLANLPAFLSARAAIKAGQGTSWVSLLNATGLTPDVLALAVTSMLTDLNKTAAGRSLVADMHAHGYARGGWIGGVGTGTSDSNLIRASRDEFMVNAGSAKKYAPWVEAINNDTFGQFLRHMVSGGSGGRASAAPAPAAAGATIHQTFPTQEMNAAELARAAAREAAWALG